MNDTPPAEQQDVISPKIYHSQIASSHNNYSIYTMYQYSSREMCLYKVMLLPSDYSHILQSIYIKRTQILEHMSQIESNDMRLPSKYFSSRLNLQIKPRTQTKECLTTIKQPYFKGVNLAQMLVEFNYSSDKQSHQMYTFLQNLIFQLINLFLRVKKQALFIPTFRTIIFDKFRNQVNINLFSFVGISLLTQKGPFSKLDLKEVLPFLDLHMFQSSDNWINLPRALAVIILGIICGKEINLLTSKEPPVRNKQQLKQRVKRNSQKYRKILQSKQVKIFLLNFQEQTKMNLKQFLQKSLKFQESLSWSESLKCLFKTNKQQMQKVNRQERQKEQKIGRQLKNIANSRWKELKEEEKMYYIYNSIVSFSSPNSCLEQQKDCQLFLIVSSKLDFTLMQNCYSLAKLSYKSQDKHTSSYNWKLDNTFKALLNPQQDQLDCDISYYLLQSNLHTQKALYPQNVQTEQNLLKQTPTHNSQQTSKLQRMVEVTGCSSSHNMQNKIVKNSFQPQSQPELLNVQLIECYRNKADLNQNSETNQTCLSLQTIQTLLYEQQVHKFSRQGTLYKIQSNWLKTLRQYEKIITE